MLIRDFPAKYRPFQGILSLGRTTSKLIRFLDDLDQRNLLRTSKMFQEEILHIQTFSGDHSIDHGYHHILSLVI